MERILEGIFSVPAENLEMFRRRILGVKQIRHLVSRNFSMGLRFQAERFLRPVIVSKVKS